MLPKTAKKTKPTLSSLILKESESHPNLTLLPKTELPLLPNLADEIRELAKETYPEFLARIREQKSRLKLLPKSVIREQLERGETILGKSLTKVKGKVYILTHTKYGEPLPEHKGWLDIKKMGKYQYLYLRWRDEDKQRSRCMGRVDLVD